VTRARRATLNARVYGELRVAVLILEDLTTIELDTETIAGLAIARDRTRAARDRLWQLVRHDVEPLERLELEIDRAADEAGLEPL